jgi:hypothetical protein
MPTQEAAAPAVRSMAVTTADHDAVSLKNAAAETARDQVDDPAPRSPRPAPRHVMRRRRYQSEDRFGWVGANAR